MMSSTQISDGNNVSKSLATTTKSFGSFPNISKEKAMKLKEQITYRFSISHSQTKGAPAGEKFTSPDFSFGGHDWHIEYYPRGTMDTDGKSISLYLYHKRGDYSRDVVALYTFALLDSRGRPVQTRTQVFQFPSSSSRAFGTREFASRTDVERLCVQNDILDIHCEIALFELMSPEDHAIQNTGASSSTAASASVLGTLLLNNKESADVSFLVEGEIVTAHRAVLAARSAVFKAQLYGPMADRWLDVILISDMKTHVFQAVIHFIYTDCLLDSVASDIDSWGLLVLEAADKYGLDGLKFLCEDKLLKAIHTDTLAMTMLAAQQHGCNKLKAACFEFLLEDKDRYVKFTTTPGFSDLVRYFPEVMQELKEKIPHV